MKLQKNFKKIFGVLLALTMVIMAVPAPMALAADDGHITLTAPESPDGEGYVDLTGMSAKAYQVLDEVEGDDTLFTVNDNFTDFFAAAQAAFYKDCVADGEMKVEKIYFSCGADGNLVLATEQPKEGAYIEVAGKDIKSLVYNETEKAYFGEAVINAILNANTGALDDDLIDSENAATLAEWLRKYAENNGVESETATLQNGDNKSADQADKLVFNNLNLGYWLIVTDNAPANVANVRSVFRLSRSDSSISAKLKLETQELEKEVKKAGEGDETYGESAITGIGDILNYRVTMKIPDLYEYDGNELPEGKTPADYVYKISDTMKNQWLVDEAVAHNQVSGDVLNKGAFTVTISYGGKSIVFKDIDEAVSPDRPLSDILKDEGSSYGTYGSGEQSFVLDFDVEKLRALEVDPDSGFGGRWEEAELTLEYSAELTSDAVWRNDNDVKLEYSNDPKTVTTKPVNDDTKVYTYGLDVTKEFEGIVDPATELADRLSDVTFQLYKAQSDGRTVGDPIQMVWTPSNYGDYKVADSDDIENGDPDNLTDDLKLSTDNVDIHVYGLDEGYYVLRETKATSGFAVAGDILVYVDADGTFLVSGSSTAFEGKVDLKAKPDNDDPDKKYLTFTVTNRAGMHLPETGGPGVVLLLFGGIALITLAAAMFIYRRKNSVK